MINSSYVFDGKKNSYLGLISQVKLSVISTSMREPWVRGFYVRLHKIMAD